MYRFLLLLALLLPALPAQAQSTSLTARVTQVDASRYPDVTIYVSVTDAAGNPVPALNQQDFQVTEDGQPVDVSAFAGGGASPINTVLVIDRSGSMDENDKLEGAQDAAHAFVSAMRPGDKTALIAFNSRVKTLEPFTDDKNALHDTIDRLKPDDGTALYDGLVAGVEALRGVGGRRALLLLTDGQDCRDADQCPDRYGSRNSLDQAIEFTRQQAQPVYVIGLGDRGSRRPDGIDETVLRRIADETGGEYFYTPDASQLTALYTRLAGSLQQEYTLTYRSPRPFYDGTRRDIRVTIAGGPVAGGGYMERHLINVHSDPLVALVLLLPVIGALLLPRLIGRRGSGNRGLPATAGVGVAAAAPVSADPPGAGSVTIHQPIGTAVLPPDVPRCHACDAPLIPPDARFCSACGIAQPQSAPAQPAFCDQCGRPLRQGAKFCPNCGSQVLLPAVTVEEGAR